MITSENVIGDYALTWGEKEFSVLRLLDKDNEAKVIQDGADIGRWLIDDNKVVINMHNPQFGQAILEIKDENTWIGKNIHTMGLVFDWTMYKVRPAKPPLHDDLMIVIHGPLHFNTVLSLFQHRDYANIVVIAPAGSGTRSVGKLVSLLTKPILYDISAAGKFNDASRYYHFYSVARGLGESDKKWAIKMRSDEFYTNLDPFLIKMKSNPNKIITNDVFFRKFGAWPYHPSDHLVGGLRDVLKKSYALAEHWCGNIREVEKFPMYNKVNLRKMVPEQHFCLAALTNFTEVLSPSMMPAHFDIVRSELLGPYRIRCNNWNKEFTDDRYIESGMDVQDASEMLAAAKMD